MIFAAASTTNVIKEIAELYTEITGIPTQTSFAASSTLARQIENGAPADVYLSANIKWMNYLKQRKLVQAKSEVILFSNELVLISANKHALRSRLSRDSLSEIESILGNNFLAMANPSHTPVGLYAKESMKNLGFWDPLKDRIARTKDVRAALMLVERKETPLGIVYRTDAMISSKVQIIASLPKHSHAPVIYLGALCGHEIKPAARQFLSFLTSEDAKTHYNQFGFIPFK